MKKPLNIYEKTYAYSTTWLDMAMESHPVITAMVGSVVIWALFL